MHVLEKQFDGGQKKKCSNPNCTGMVVTSHYHKGVTYGTLRYELKCYLGVFGGLRHGGAITTTLNSPHETHILIKCLDVEPYWPRNGISTWANPDSSSLGPI